MLGQNYVNIKGQKLNKFRYSVSGDMTGGHYTKTVKAYDDNTAVVIIDTAEWHNEPSKIEEYQVDIAILEELEKIIRRYKMNHWNKKKFTNMFVSDGASKGYSFDFEKAGIYFSSQIYPPPYSSKLKAFDEVIDKYLETGKRL